MRPRPADTHQGQRPWRRAERPDTRLQATTTASAPTFLLPARGPSTQETFWATFLKSLVKRGLHGVKLVVSDAHEGLKGAIRRVMGATWQRCRVHWMRNALAYVPKGKQTMVAAALRQAFLQPADQDSARKVWRGMADQFRLRWPKLAKLLDESEHDVLAYMGFPVQHRVKLHSVNPLERLNREVKRRADVSRLPSLSYMAQHSGSGVDGHSGCGS
jgi:transposase-like protein